MDSLLFQKVDATSAHADQAAIADLARTTFLQTFGAVYNTEDKTHYIETRLTDAVLLAEMADALSHFYLVKLEGRPIGYLKWIVPCFKYFEGPITWQRPLLLERFYFLNGFHGIGIAAVALQFVLSQAKYSAESDYIYLSVWENNLKAQSFYQKFGFRTISTFGYQVGQQVDKEYLYGLKL